MSLGTCRAFIPRMRHPLTIFHKCLISINYYKKGKKGPVAVLICNDQHITCFTGRFQWVTQLRPGWLSKFMPTVSCMRPPFKYHSKLAKSIASIDLKTKPCKCTKTETTHTCTLPFVVKICNEQGPVVQKLINANPRLKINLGVIFLYSQILFNTDIQQNFALAEVNPEREK